MYELFLLGKLLARPWYGYEFQQALGGFFGSQRKVSWGTVYPLFQRLQREALIRALPSKPNEGRDKQAYAITSAGRKRFLELMNTERPGDPDFREIFRIKLGHFGRVSRETQKQIVVAQVDRLAAIRDHTTRMLGVIKQRPEMDQEEKEMIMRAIRHERSLAEAELRWVRKELENFL